MASRLPSVGMPGADQRLNIFPAMGRVSQTPGSMAGTRRMRPDGIDGQEAGGSDGAPARPRLGNSPPLTGGGQVGSAVGADGSRDGRAPSSLDEIIPVGLAHGTLAFAIARCLKGPACTRVLASLAGRELDEDLFDISSDAAAAETARDFSRVKAMARSHEDAGIWWNPQSRPADVAEGMARLQRIVAAARRAVGMGGPGTRTPERGSGVGGGGEDNGGNRDGRSGGGSGGGGDAGGAEAGGGGGEHAASKKPPGGSYSELTKAPAAGMDAAVDPEVVAPLGEDGRIQHEFRRGKEVAEAVRKGGDQPAHEDVIYEMLEDPEHDQQAVLALYLSNGFLTESSAGARAPARLVAARKGSVGRVKAWLDKLVGKTGAVEARDAIKRLSLGAHTGILLWEDIVKVLGATPSTEIYSAGTGKIGAAKWGDTDAKADVRDATRHLGTLLFMTFGEAMGLDAGDVPDDRFGLGALGKAAVRLEPDKVSKLFKWVLGQLALQCEAVRTQLGADMPDLQEIVRLAATVGMGKEVELQNSKEVMLEAKRDGEGGEHVAGTPGKPRAQLTPTERAAKNKEREERRKAGKRARAKEAADAPAPKSKPGTPAGAGAAGGASKLPPIERKYVAISAFESAARKAEADGGMGCEMKKEPCPWFHLFGRCKDGCARCKLGLKAKAGMIDAVKAELSPEVLELVTGSG